MISGGAIKSRCQVKWIKTEAHHSSLSVTRIAILAVASSICTLVSIYFWFCTVLQTSLLDNTPNKVVGCIIQKRSMLIFVKINLMYTNRYFIDLGTFVILCYCFLFTYALVHCDFWVLKNQCVFPRKCSSSI